MTTGPILCLAITPAVQRTLFMRAFRPGEVNRSRKTLLSAAGKGVNVALALARLESPARLVGFRGGDGGRFVAQALAEAGVDARWVETGAPTRHCHTVVEEDTGRVTELVEEAAPPSSAEWGRLDEAIRSALPGCSWLALSGALPPGAPADMLARICALAGAGGLKLCVDSQGEPLLGCLKDKPALVKLNAEELARTLGLDDPTPAALTGAARRLRDLGAATVFVTDGDRPARLFTEEAEQAFSIPRVSVVNPIGSGDCVTAGLLHALREGRPLPEAARFGLACGSANAETDVPALFDPARVRALTSA